MKSTLKVIVSILSAAAFSSCLTSCHEGFLHNANDWQMKKGAMPVYVPLQVSKKTYR